MADFVRDYLLRRGVGIADPLWLQGMTRSFLNRTYPDFSSYMDLARITSLTVGETLYPVFDKKPGTTRILERMYVPAQGNVQLMKAFTRVYLASKGYNPSERGVALQFRHRGR